MRRTQAKLCEFSLDLAADPCLADQPCRRCGMLGATIVALGRNDAGAIDLAWCSPLCAGADGNPLFRHLPPLMAGAKTACPTQS